MAARTDSGIAHNGDQWSGKRTILVSTGAGWCLRGCSTTMTSLVGSATESVDTTICSAAEMSPSISLALTEALMTLVGPCKRNSWSKLRKIGAGSLENI